MKIRAYVIAVVVFGSRLAAGAPQKSPTVATAYALGGTAASLAIGTLADTASPGALRTSGLVFASIGIIASPSLGHLYAGETTHALRWTSVRAISFGTAISGAYLAANNDAGPKFAGGLAAAALGTSVFAVGLTWDLYDAHRAARRANHRRANVNMTVVPFTHASATGIGIVGAF